MFEIEEKTVIHHDARKSTYFTELVIALKTLKKGQSFLVGSLSGNHRLAISVAQTLLDITIATRKEGDSYRIGRVE